MKDSGAGISGAGLKGGGSSVAGFIPSPAGGGGGALTDARANRALLSSSAKPMLSHSPDANARVINLGASPSSGGEMKPANSVGAAQVRSLAYRAYGLDSSGDAKFSDEIQT